MPVRRDHTPYSADEDALIVKCAAEGLGSEPTARRLNAEFHDGIFVRSTAAIMNRRNELKAKVANRGHKPRVLQLPPPALVASLAADPLDWLERIRPVAVAAPSRPRVTLQPTAGLTMVAGDFHFGCHDARAISVFLETAAKLKPSRVILNGDLPDLLAVSRYPKDARPAHSWTLRDEATAMHTFLRDLESVVPQSCEIVETEANHSGNGTASRWWRYLSDFAAQIVQLPGAEDRLSYQTWWYPDWSRIQLVESVVIAGDLLVLHGDIVRKHAAYSARATMEKWASSVMHNHTHRQGSGAQRVPAIPGRPESVQRFYETGCMCDLNPSYASAANWTQGFAIVREEGSRYGVELVTIDDGAAVVATLGQVVKAA